MISKQTTHLARIQVLIASIFLVLCGPIACSDDDSKVDPEEDMSIPARDMAGDQTDSGEAADSNETSLLDLPVGEAGPYNTGYRSVVHTFEPIDGESREIVVNIWYPTAATDGEVTRYLGRLRDTESFLGAEPIESPWPDGNFPVHVYSHGDRGFGGTAAQLMRHFASHGWVSIAPDHTDNTIENLGDDRPPVIRVLRSLDISASLDAAAEVDGDLEGLLETEEVFMSGHSFGGFTVWATAGSSFDQDAVRTECQVDSTPLCTPKEVALFAEPVADSRVAAALTIAGNYREAWFGPDGFSNVDIPIIALSGTADPRGHEEEFETITGVDLTWIDVEGACHESFTLGSGCSTLDDTAAFTIVDSYALAAARHYILEDESEPVLDLLNGEAFPNENIATFRQK